MNELIFKILAIYIAQVGLCGIINGFNTTRIPKNTIDFLKLTFLPFVIFNLKNIKRI